MDRDKIPHLVIYCLGLSLIIYLYDIKVAFVLVSLSLTIWAYANLISDIFFKAKEIKSNAESKNKKLLISASAAIIMTVLGAFFFTKLIWGYVAVLTAIVLLPVIWYKLKN